MDIDSAFGTSQAKVAVNEGRSQIIIGHTQVIRITAQIFIIDPFF